MLNLFNKLWLWPKTSVVAFSISVLNWYKVLKILKVIAINEFNGIYQIQLKEKIHPRVFGFQWGLDDCENPCHLMMQVPCDLSCSNKWCCYTIKLHNMRVGRCLLNILSGFDTFNRFRLFWLLTKHEYWVTISI